MLRCRTTHFSGIGFRSRIPALRRNWPNVARLWIASRRRSSNCGASVTAWRQERVTWQETVGARERTIRDIAAERDQFAIERDHFAATRDRYQSNGKRIKAEKLQLEAEKLQLETICKFPGVKKALVKATHPDTGTGGDVRSRTKIFQALQAVYDRIEGR